MKPVIIESPFAGHRYQNCLYAWAAVIDSLERGEQPLASHLIYTIPLDDTIPEERAKGIAAIEPFRAVSLTVFYVDLGWSNGMLSARRALDETSTKYEVRRLGADWDLHLFNRLSWGKIERFARMMAEERFARMMAEDTDEHT